MTSDSDPDPDCEECGHPYPSVREWPDAPGELLCIVCVDQRQDDEVYIE